MMASMLTERIQLWKKDIVDNEFGDASEKWTHIATVWADVRLKSVDNDSMLLDVRIRPTAYKFHRLYWHGLWADCFKDKFNDRKYLRFFAKSRADLTGS